MNCDGIPAELRAIPNWIAYGAGKIPLIPGTHARASVDDPATWSGFDAARAGMNGHAGLGWVVTPQTGIVLIDIDHCRDAATGEIAIYAQRTVERISSYAEVSPSGTGIHIVVKSTLPAGARKRGSLEMYADKRFFCFTGEKLPGAPNTIETVNVDWLHRLMASDVFSFEKTLKLKSLMNGDWTGYPSQSEADLAFASTLAHLGLNSADIDSAFRLSGLYREKWERADYREETITKALAGKTSTAPATVTTNGSSRFSEDEIAKRFAQLYGADVRYSAEMASWLFWDGKVLRRDAANIVADLSRDVCREAALEADAIKPGKGRTLASYRTMRAVLNIASADPALAVMAEELDADPMLFNCRNGVIDLRTGELLPHGHSRLITKIAGCELAQEGTPAPLWTKFLDRVTGGNIAQQAYLQELCGYCLTGVTSEQKAHFAYGTGANGKTVFVNAITEVMGDYAGVTPSEVFLASHSSQHPTGIADMRGKRLIVATELEQGARWAESRLKELTGGDMVKARFMGRDFFQFRPSAKIFLIGNHKPTLRGTDEGIKRRLHLLPFTVTIPEHERDLHLDEKLRAEYPAILRWMLEGCLRWQQTGLKAPEIVRDASADYLAEENRLARWIEQSCTILNNFSFSDKPVPVSTLYRSWKLWAEENGEWAGGVTGFSQMLESVPGIRRKRTADTRGFLGIQLKGWEPRQAEQ
jgi:P4 family phage/plasmid primase-like protien